MELNAEERKQMEMKLRSTIAQAISELAESSASQFPLANLQRAQACVIKAATLAVALDPSDVADIMEIQA